MQIALISDTHGHLDARIATVIESCAQIVHAGDVGDSVAATLAALGPPVTIVAGNNDPAGAAWPAAAELALPDGTLAVIHGHQWPARNRHRKLRQRYPDARAVVCGHSHRQVVDDGEVPWILNPGAAGRIRTYGGPACLVLQANRRGWQITPYRFPK